MFNLEIWNIFEQFNSSKNIDELWIELRKALSPFGVTSILYGVTYSPEKLFRVGAEQTMQYKTDHPLEYRNYFDETFNMVDDITAVHCINNESSYLWHKDGQYGYDLSHQQDKFLKASGEFGMSVGVTVPIRFGMGGAGGMGICNKGMLAKDFDLMWKQNGGHILSICRFFDEAARKNCTKELFRLTPIETEILHYLADGNPIKTIAYKLKKSPSTVDKQARQAKEKLKARNYEQAVFIAYKLGLISP